MADLQKGVTFAEDGTYHAADFNNLVDDGVILPAFISGKTSVNPTGVDSFVFYQSGSGLLKRCTFDQLISQLPSGADADVFSLRKLGTAALMAAAGNDTRFPASVTGIRLGAGAGSHDLAAGAKDLSLPTVSLATSTDLDWDAGNVFYDSIVADKTYTFSNMRNGRTITFIIRLNGHTATVPVGTAVSTVGTGTTFWWMQLTKIQIAGGAIGIGLYI